MDGAAGSYRDRVYDLTTTLLPYRSTADNPTAIKETIDHLAAVFDSADVPYKRYRSAETPSLIASADGSFSPTLLLHGHIDVVPGDADLFEPTITDGMLYGRGAADMKGGVAAMTHVLLELAALADPPSVDLMLVSDEERGGEHGVQYHLDRGYTPSFVITGEPNNMGGTMDVILRQKGILQVELTATGAPAHAATPQHGENAIETLLGLSPKLQSLAESYDGDWTPTVNIGRIDGGTVLNQVPDTATMGLDIRYPDQATRDELLAELRSLPEIEVSVLGDGAPVNTSPEHPIAQLLKRQADRFVDAPVQFADKPHASDLRHFAAVGIPGAVFGPEAYGSHERDERLVLESLDPYCQTLYATATQVAEHPIDINGADETV